MPKSVSVSDVFQFIILKFDTASYVHSLWKEKKNV